MFCIILPQLSPHRARRAAEQELHDARDQVHELGNQAQILGTAKRALDAQLQTLHVSCMEGKFKFIMPRDVISRFTHLILG